MLKVSGVVALYHPKSSIIENIQSYIDFIDNLYVVDNSGSIDSDVIDEIKKIKKCIYVSNNGNQGIAHALNVGVGLASNNDASWVLTMDQDSFFEEGALNNMLHWIGLNDTERVGIVSPIHETVGRPYDKSNDTVEVLTTMASGNLLNVKAYKVAGPFRDDFFIDCVDHEYCLRLKTFNYKTLLNCSSVLKHNLGDSAIVSFMGVSVVYTNHNRIRRYYRTRNRLKVIKMYWLKEPMYCVREIRCFFSSWVKIILFDKNVMEKQKAIFLGVSHFIMGKSGKIQHKM